MLSDTRQVEPGSTLSFDVCVIGSGAAGVTVALALAGPGVTVGLLEAGSTAPEPVGEVEATGLPIGIESRQRAFGGTTTTWWGKVAALDPLDLEARPWVPSSGWPVPAAELAEQYRRAADFMGLPDMAEIGRELAGRHPAGRLDGSALRTAPFHWRSPPLDFGELCRQRAGSNPYLQPLLGATVTGIVLDPAGGRVERLEVRGQGDRRFEVRARGVVIACGAIENARLLLASNRQHPAGVGNHHDQVGRWFMEHPKGPCGSVVIRPGPSATHRSLPDRSYWRGQPATGGGRVRCGIKLGPEAQRRHQVLNSYVLLDADPLDTVMRLVRHVRGRRWRSLAAGRDLVELAADFPDLVRFAQFRATNRPPAPRFSIQNFMEQAPDARNRVELGPGRDSLGRPPARLTWTIGDLDRRTVQVLHQELDAELRRRDLGRVESPLLGPPQAWPPWPVIRDSSHHMGTTRMGTDPRTSVVDPDCRVHGLGDLYVAGSSVFPTGGHANPTLTIVALALRLADHLRRRLGRGPA